MELLRFKLKTLLIVVTVSAIWLSTLRGYRGSTDIQALLWTAITVMSGVAAINLTERRRAFWTGFFGTLLLTSTGKFFFQAGVKFDWAPELARELTENWLGGASGRGVVVVNVHSTLTCLSLAASATVIGFLCVLVYDQTRK